MSQVMVTFYFHAVSYALYGRETVHVQLRLLAAVEILLNPELYDKTSEAYYAPYSIDERLVLTDYRSFVCESVKNSTDSDMHTVLALSSVIHKLIQTRWPIVPCDAWPSPLMKLVVGRNVQMEHAINIQFLYVWR